LAASRVKTKLKIVFPVPGLVVVAFLLVDGGLVDGSLVDGGFVNGGLVVGGLGSTLQIRNKMITITRNFDSLERY
jgi:Na+-transporting methylmalonyl-CoA/oxaloacetate decarboxylase beta subunit